MAGSCGRVSSALAQGPSKIKQIYWYKGVQYFSFSQQQWSNLFFFAISISYLHNISKKKNLNFIYLQNTNKLINLDKFLYFYLIIFNNKI